MDLRKVREMSATKVNLLVLIVESLMLLSFLWLSYDSILLLIEGTFPDGFSGLKNILWGFNFLLIFTSLIYFIYKPLRTTATILCGIWNINWLAANIFLMNPF
jgi:hypothetical protein